MVVSDDRYRVFFTQYLDKQSLSYASVYGLLTDLDLTAKQYSWLTSCFYISQLASEGPFIYLMSRLPIAKFIGSTVIIWVRLQWFLCRVEAKLNTVLSYRVLSVCVLLLPTTLLASQLCDACLDSRRVQSLPHL